MATQGTPTLDQFKAWLGLDAGDNVDDAVLTDSLKAALAAQAMTVAYPLADDTEPDGDVTFTDDLTTAIWLRAQRLAARRNSPEGVVGISSGSGDFTGARLPATDVDVARLEAPWTVIGVA
jgi:hypothetical protein